MDSGSLRVLPKLHEHEDGADQDHGEHADHFKKSPPWTEMVVTAESHRAMGSLGVGTVTLLVAQRDEPRQPQSTNHQPGTAENNKLRSLLYAKPSSPSADAHRDAIHCKPSRKARPDFKIVSTGHVASITRKCDTCSGVLRVLGREGLSKARKCGCARLVLIPHYALLPVPLSGAR
jgi:hypothetical protein